MSRIYKVEEVNSLPASGEKDVLYLVAVSNAKEVYMWNGISFVEICPREWKFHSYYGSMTDTAYVEDIASDASEFLVRIWFDASDRTDAFVDIIIPNINPYPGGRGKYNYMGGYYYDASYNCSFMAQYDNSTVGEELIKLVSSWSHVVGSQTGFSMYEVFYR